MVALHWSLTCNLLSSRTVASVHSLLETVLILSFLIMTISSLPKTLAISTIVTVYTGHQVLSMTLDYLHVLIVYILILLIGFRFPVSAFPLALNTALLIRVWKMLAHNYKIICSPSTRKCIVLVFLITVPVRPTETRESEEWCRAEKKKKSDNQAQNDKEVDQKAKERQGKKKNKDEEQRRQNFLQEARKVQAAQRWSSTSSNSDVTIVTPQSANFIPVPLHWVNGSSTPLPLSSPQDLPLSCTSAPSHADQQTNQLSANPLTTEQDTTPSLHSTPAQSTALNQCTTPAPPKASTQRTTPAQRTTPVQCTNKTPAGGKQAATPRTSHPRRGIHFESAVGDSSEDKVSEEDEDCSSVADESGSSGSCCKEQKIENEALRKRLEMVHRRLNIACK